MRFKHTMGSQKNNMQTKGMLLEENKEPKDENKT